MINFIHARLFVRGLVSVILLANSLRLAAETLKVGDVVKISFSDAPNLDVTQQIRRDGRINLFQIGEMKVVDKTPAELERELLQAYPSREVRVTVVGMMTNAFVDRWALTIPGGAAGWLEVKKENGWLDGSILWGSGSVVPLASVTIADGTLTVTRVTDVERKDAAGKVVRKQQLTETITAQLEGDALKLTRVAPRANGSGFDRVEFSGKRIPPRDPLPRVHASVACMRNSNGGPAVPPSPMSREKS